MYLINIKILLVLAVLFISCEEKSDPINISSDIINTTISFDTYNLDLINSVSIQDLDSLNISNSDRLYAGTGFTNENLNSHIFLSLDVSKIKDDSACSSENFSAVKLELSSYNKLINKDADSSISEIYIDTINTSGISGIKIFAGDIGQVWEDISYLDYNNFNYQNLSTVKYEIDEYDIIIDLDQQNIADFCNLDKIDFVVTYSNSLSDESILDFIEIISSDYIYEPSRPKLQLDYSVLEEQTIVNNKYSINSCTNISSQNFNAYIVNNAESDDWGKIYLMNLEDEGLESNLSQPIFVDTLNLVPILDNAASDYPVLLDLKVEFLIDGMLNSRDDFLPIEFYLDGLIGYVESSDPEGDNWQDCGSDGLCSNDAGYDFPDLDGTEGNGIWDIGEKYENNKILDWEDQNQDLDYDYGERLLENYDDFGLDQCANEYESGNNGCYNELGLNNYNPLGTESNNRYDYGEKIIQDHGSDGCPDEYEDGIGGCLELLNPNYNSDNFDPNGDNYNSDPSKDNWNDYGSDGCPDEYEDGNGGCLQSVNQNYSSENSDLNGDNYSFLDNPGGTQSNSLWDSGEGTEQNNMYDLGENYYDFGINGVPDQLEENPEADNWQDCGSDGLCANDVGYDSPDLDGTEGNGVWNEGEGTEGNSLRDLGEPYDDFGSDNLINWQEPSYSIGSDATENNGSFDENELYEDSGVDGCFNEYEDGNGGCFESINPDYDENNIFDPNEDYYIDDINSDDWGDCGSDGLCANDAAYDSPDLDGTEGNGVWDIGEGKEGNNQIDWNDSNFNNIIDESELIVGQSENWYDEGYDNVSDSDEYLESGNYLSYNVIHGPGLTAQLFSDEGFDANIDNLIDTSKDINLWISEIYKQGGNYIAIIKVQVSSSTKAIEFNFRHSPNIYTDNVLTDYTSVYYSSYNEGMIQDVSVYPINQINDNLLSNNIFMNYHRGIEMVLNFGEIEEFFTDSTLIINKDNTNLYLFLDRSDPNYYFESGFLDIECVNFNQSLYLDRVYFDSSDSLIVPIGDVVQKFVNKESNYDGFNLRLSGYGNNFGTLVFDNSEDLSKVSKINIMYSK
tara:strand:- start:5946 stop:9164 length:3219 start_codon:yes stop_codon:yes gene_type:complete